MALYRIFLLSAFSCFSWLSYAQSVLDQLSIPGSHQQVVLVTTSDWDTKTGTLQCYSRANGNWTKHGERVEVSLGKNGLAWGRGLHANTSVVEKVEGDGKAPAGVFLFDFVFGYEKVAPAGTLFPYRQSTARDYFVDATGSDDYNQWVSVPADQPNEPKRYWASFERMKRSDHLYELGIVVQHNYNPPVPGKGSAIFLHVWRSPGSPTLGCTAMSKENLMKLLGWLDPEKEPLLIQVPDRELEKLKFR
ncbi:hypothetical protein JMN32_04410 [Fulvivirga sp. 29W222]|uniref:L,D-TPase catalytic domain-containing protein n=1 Tax=Fulvivirga marina TaxID=2494733 RepID=A0A937FV68_9BACT|nr:L,D-transpeptidase family protein [Fulvivirga marina]MBL6445537.1 hypothetical protein [Fulvivirga marina]